MKRAVSFGLCVAVLILCLAPMGCGIGTPPKSRLFYDYFDTVCALYDYSGEGDEPFRKRTAAAEETLELYHRLLDIYHEYEDTVNLATLNRLAGTGPVEVSAELFDFLSYAKDMYTLTRGQTNIAMGAVLSLWHTAREAAASGEGTLPSPDALTEAARHTDIACLVLDEQACTVTLTDPALRLDAGALGKGYAAERLYERLLAMGASSCAIDLGGNLRAVGGKPDGTPFTAGIRDPEDEGALVRTVELTEGSCVTSGSYERYMTVDGVRYHHIIDPDTLYPATHFVSVTVLARDSGLCDALSTALFCMSREEAEALLADLEGVRAVLIASDGTVTAHGF